MKCLDLPIDRIHFAPQVRELFDDEPLGGLARSLATIGLQQPILVRPDGDGWLVIDGERRVRAAMLVGWETIPAIVDDREATEATTVQRQLVANCQRADLTPVETAKGIDRLMNATGWTAARVATELGLSPATVSKLLALLVLPKEVQDQVHAGTLAASTAYELAKIRDPKKRAKLTAEAAAGGLTREGVVARGAGSGKEPPAVRAARRPSKCKQVVVALGEGRKVTVAGPGLTLAALAAWTEELLARLRRLGEKDMDLREAAKALSAQRR
jgi:ParB family transcriptional regulator, chromosome partitioning protein